MTILTHPDHTYTYFQERGDPSSPTLLLLHGLGADHAMWEPQLQVYVEAGYHLLVPDLFGHGRSSKLPRLSMQNWHDQLNGLLDARYVKKVNIIGVSMGGVIAQSFVVNYPNKVNTIAIADSFGELRTVREKILGLSQVLGFQLFKRLGHQRFIHSLQRLYQVPHAKKARHYFSQMALTLDWDQMIRARIAINQIDGLQDLRAVPIPALVIVGADFGQGFIDINQKIAKALPNSKFVILPKAMDPSNLVNPVGFDRHILQFLKMAID